MQQCNDTNCNSTLCMLTTRARDALLLYLSKIIYIYIISIYIYISISIYILKTKSQ